MPIGKNYVGDLLFEKECYIIIDIAMKVHSVLKRGFKEIVYKDAIEIEFIRNKIPFFREKSFKINYCDSILKHSFQADFFVFEAIIVEIKATTDFHYDHFQQTLNYLRASEVKLGLLINFGKKSLEFKRIICT